MSRLRGLAGSMTAARRAAATLLHPAPLPAVLCSAARHYSTPPLTSESVFIAVSVFVKMCSLLNLSAPSSLFELVCVCVCVRG